MNIGDDIVQIQPAADVGHFFKFDGLGMTIEKVRKAANRIPGGHVRLGGIWFSIQVAGGLIQPLTPADHHHVWRFGAAT